MVWLPMKDASKRLGCSVDTIKRRTKLPEDDPRYLPTEHEPLPRGGYKILVQVPDDAPQAAQDADPQADSELRPNSVRNSEPESSHWMTVLRAQSEAHEREIARLQAQYAETLLSKDETLISKDETIAALKAELHRLQRPWWRFWR